MFSQLIKTKQISIHATNTMNMIIILKNAHYSAPIYGKYFTSFYQFFYWHS